MKLSKISDLASVPNMELDILAVYAPVDYPY